MGWSVGFDSRWNRDIGYGVPSICDYPGCNKKIDRGLSCVCGGEPYGGDNGCGLYFCEDHLLPTRNSFLCERCATIDEQGQCLPPFDPKPDTEEWIQHKLNDPSWQEWRDCHQDDVEQLMARG